MPRRCSCNAAASRRYAMQLQAQPQADVHALVGLAQERHGSLMDLPWQPMVLAMAAAAAPPLPGAGP